MYSNKLGYVAGVQLAILTAKICQFYPRAVASTVVMKFFHAFGEGRHAWKWPRPVELRPREKKGWPLDREVWQPRERKEVMPIITPAYPAMNTTFAVNRATLRALRTELRRGDEFCKAIEAGTESWAALLRLTSFFAGRFRHFFRVDVAAGTADQLLRWHGLCETSIKHFANEVEKTSKGGRLLWLLSEYGVRC